MGWDEDQQKLANQEEKEQLERLQELEDTKFILSSDQGVRFFKRMFDKGFIFNSTFTGNSSTFYKEGHRNFALMYLHDIAEISPEKIQELLIRKGESSNE